MSRGDPELPITEAPDCCGRLRLDGHVVREPVDGLRGAQSGGRIRVPDRDESRHGVSSPSPKNARACRAEHDRRTAAGRRPRRMNRFAASDRQWTWGIHPARVMRPPPVRWIVTKDLEAKGSSWRWGMSPRTAGW